MAAFLEDEDLFGVIEESKTQFVNRAAQRRKAERKVYSTLMLCLDDDVLKYATDVKPGDGLQLWKAMCKQFERSTFGAKRKLLTELFNLRQRSSEPVADFIFRAHRIQHRLDDLNLKLHDSLVLTVLVNGVKPEFDQLVTVITTQENITLAKAEDMLREHAERTADRRDDKVDTDGEPLLLGDSDFSGRSCWTCGERGHISATCARRCKVCNRLGHHEDRCYSNTGNGSS